MIYLEDIIELIEDVPDELQRRGGLIQDWERQASEYKREADKLTTRLHNDNSLRDEEKASIYRQISEMLERARDVTEKKFDMADKCHQLLKKLSDRVSDWSYHCKLELEVDAPGSTFTIENTFLNETVATATAAANIRSQGQTGAFRVPEEKPQRDRVGSSSISRESTPMYGGRTGGDKRTARETTRDSSISSSRASSTAPYDSQSAAVQQLQQRKRKRDRQRERQQAQQRFDQQQAAARAAAPTPPLPVVLKDPMSSYMRKKKEREREERKLREVHANRERNSQQRVIKPEPLDDGYEPVPTPPPSQNPMIGRRPGPGRPPGSSRVTVNPLLPPAPPRVTEPERREEPEDPLTGGLSDMDDSDDLLKFLEDAMPEGIVDHDDLSLGLEDENMYMATFGADLGKALEKIQERPPSPLGHNIYGTLNAPTHSSAASSSRYSDKSATKAEKKRQQAQLQPQLTFATFAGGESKHGRPRKVTARGADYTIDMDTRERRRRLKDDGEYGHHRRESRGVSLVDETLAEAAGEEDVDNTPYCYCMLPSEGVMVGCEGKRCRYGGWFHLSCLGMLAPPAVEKWYCLDCRKPR